MTEIRLYRPKGLKYETVLPLELHKYAPHAAYLVSSIIQRTVKPSGYVTINAAMARSFFPNNPAYTQVRDALLASGVIECDFVHVSGERSYGYRLGKEWIDRPVRRFILQDKLLLKKIRGRPTATAVGLRSPVHDRLFANLQKIEIDPEAYQELKRFRGRRRNTLRIAIDRIMDKQFFCSVCHYGRFHSNLTNFRSVVRPYLRVKHDAEGVVPLVNLDISNSQPLFLCLDLLKKTKLNLSSSKNSFNEINSFNEMINNENELIYFNEKQINQNSLDPKTLIKLREKQIAGNKYQYDVSFFVSLCEAGQIYEYLMRRLAKPGGSYSPEERGRFKKKFFREVFYGKTETTINSEFGKLFAQDFPSVYAAILEEKELGYQFFSRRMQMVESDFIIGTVCRRVMEEFPDAWFNTIHDSILCTEEYADRVLGIMREEFGVLGLNPTIKVEQLMSSCR